MGRSGAILLWVLACSACDCADSTSTGSDDRRVVADGLPVIAAQSPPHTRQAAERSLSWLSDQVRVPAGDPSNPWALAHGLLAFGKDFKTQDGRSAVEVVASFAQRDAPADARVERYRFPFERDGKPIEPHSYLFVKTFLEIGLAPTFELRTADGTTIDVRRLLTDMRANVTQPANDHEWHDSAWWLTAMELDSATESTARPSLRQTALVRLEADNAVISGTTSNAFAADAPMGAAKRNKSHIYGHPCGGLHFMQAVLRGAKGNTSSEFIARVGRQLQLLLARHAAERILYADILRTHPTALLPISGQQLKFFGHVLETLAVAEEVGLLRHDAALAQAVEMTRQQATADLLATIAQLDKTGAYTRLSDLSVQQPQLFLDLIGDGCHAIHGLQRTLAVLPTD